MNESAIHHRSHNTHHRMMLTPYDYSWDHLFDAALNDAEYLATIVDKHRAFIDGTDSIGESSILHYLAYDNSYDSAKVLLEAGANPNLVNKNGESPLHWAVRMRSLNVAMLLIEHDANVNLADASGSTALHYACASGTPEIIPLLLLGRCDTSLRDISNKTALDLAEESTEGSHAACAMLLYRHQRDPESAQQLMQQNTRLRNLAKKKANATKVEKFPRTDTKEKIPTSTGDTLKPPVSSSKPNLSHTTPKPRDKLKHDLSSGTMATTKRPPKSQSDTIKRTSNPQAEALAAVPLAYYPSPKSRAGSSSNNSVTSVEAPNKRCMYPFTPNSCDYWDVVIAVEQCADCDTSHNMSVRHDADKYSSVATDILLSLLRQCVASKKFLRVFGMKSKPLDHTRIGALEVSVSVKVSSSFTDALERSTADGDEGVIVGNKWMSKTIFSKLQTKSWPVVASLKDEVDKYLKEVMQQHPWRDPNERDETDAEAEKKGQSIESSYTQWLVRTSSTEVPSKITPEIWLGDAAHELYHKGLFLTPYDSSYDVDQWEKSAMYHFLVYDGRKHHRRLAVDANGPSNNPHSHILRMFSR